METYEFEGKTDQNAIEKACRQLDLTRDQIDIVVIEPGSSGIFGLVGGRKAKIKVTIKPKEPDPIETQENEEAETAAAPEETVVEAAAAPEETVVKPLPPRKRRLLKPPQPRKKRLPKYLPLPKIYRQQLTEKHPPKMLGKVKSPLRKRHWKTFWP